jgi:carbamoylphosphate synthase small subunit
MTEINKKRAQINATVPPYVKNRCKERAENSEFFTVSSLVTVALVEFISKWDERQKLNDKDFVKKIIIAVIKKIDTMNINPEQLEEMIKTGEIFKKIEE